MLQRWSPDRQGAGVVEKDAEPLLRVIRSQSVMASLLKPLLAILLVVALAVAPAAQASAAVPCGAMHLIVSGHQGSPDHARDPVPCEKMTPACVYALGCVTIVNLPAPAISTAAPMTWTHVAYWAATDAREGLPSNLPSALLFRSPDHRSAFRLAQRAMLRPCRICELRRVAGSPGRIPPTRREMRHSERT